MQGLSHLHVGCVQVGGFPWFSHRISTSLRPVVPVAGKYSVTLRARRGLQHF